MRAGRVRRVEHGADDALLPPCLACAKLAAGGEARELRTRTRTARRAVVRVAGTQHEVPRAPYRRERNVNLDVIDFGAVVAAYALRIERRAHGTRKLRQALDVLRNDVDAGRFDEEEPVAAPCDVAAYSAVTGHVDAHVLRMAVARHVRNRDAMPVVQFDAD